MKTQDDISNGYRANICSVTIMRDVTSGEADDAVESAQPLIDGWILYPGGKIDDFSKVRNGALTLAAEKGFDWAIMLDTDEFIHPRGPLTVGNGLTINWQSLHENMQASDLKNVLAECGHDMLHVWADDHSYAKPRFFRLPARGHYKGPTHECWIADPGSTVGTLEGITFSELPKTAEQYKVKAERDRDILEKHTQEHPDDPRWWYYLGDTYSGLGMKEEAKRAFLKCYLLDGWDEEAAWAAYRKATIEIEEGDYAWALSSCVSGMKHHPGMAELPWLAGYCCYKLGRYQHAIWWEMMATALNDDDAEEHRINFRHEPALWEGPADVLKHAYTALGKSGAAEFWGKSCDRVMKMRLDKSRAT